MYYTDSPEEHLGIVTQHRDILSVTYTFQMQGNGSQVSVIAKPNVGRWSEHRNANLKQYYVQEVQEAARLLDLVERVP